MEVRVEDLHPPLASLLSAGSIPITPDQSSQPTILTGYLGWVPLIVRIPILEWDLLGSVFVDSCYDILYETDPCNSILSKPYKESTGVVRSRKDCKHCWTLYFGLVGCCTCVPLSGKYSLWGWQISTSACIRNVSLSLFPKITSSVLNRDFISYRSKYNIPATWTECKRMERVL